MTRTKSIVVFLLLLLAGNVFGQAPVVSEIVIEGQEAGLIDQSFIRSHTQSRTNEPLDRAQVSGDVRALLGTGAFSYVGVELEPTTDDRVRLIYRVKGKPVLAEAVALVGVEHFRESKVRSWLELEAGDMVDDQALGVAALKVREEYRQEHFPQARVTWLIDEIQDGTGRVTVQVTVDEGKRARVVRVDFVGNETMPYSELRKAMGFRGALNPIQWFSKRRYDPEEFEIGVQLVREIYLDRGYLEVKVGSPAVVPDEDGDLRVVVEIEEGRTYRCGEIEIEGITLFPEGELRQLVRLEPGGLAAMSAIRETASAIQDYYGSRGYLGTRVQPVLDPVAGEAVVDVRFSLREGMLTHIGNIRIRGNTRTRDKVIRRELLVYPGDVLNEVRARRSERRLMNTGFFESVRRLTETTPEPGVRDLVFQMEEKRTGQFMVGAGFSSVDNMVGYVELSQGNFDLMGWPYFTGGGQKLKVRAQFGKTRKDYELSFVEPWFLNRRLSLGFDLFRHDYSYDDYDVERVGGAVSVGRALPWGSRINLRYKLERSKVEDLEGDTNVYYYADETLDEYMFDLNEDRTESSLRVTVSRDTRNSPFFPSRGNQTSVFGSLSGGALGFDTDLYRLGLRSDQHFRLWFDHVLSFRARYEVVEEYGDTDEVPLSSRLFIGGGRTVRGYDYRDVGPKVTLDPGATVGSYKAVGGGSMAFGSVEYTVPLIPNIRMGAFYDVGNVWRDPYELDVSDLASGAGVGIRFDIPGFPIRIDRAWSVDKDHPLTDLDEWVIWIGY